jgi:hypothetical protein
VPGSVDRGGGTIGSSVSTSTLTTWAVIVATTSVLLLVVLDRRQPARRRRVTPREGVLLPRPAPAVVEVIQLPSKRYRRTPIWRRFLSLTFLGGFGVVLGALLALALAVLIVGGFLLIGHFAG